MARGQAFQELGSSTFDGRSLLPTLTLKVLSRENPSTHRCNYADMPKIFTSNINSLRLTEINALQKFRQQLCLLSIVSKRVGKSKRHDQSLRNSIWNFVPICATLCLVIGVLARFLSYQRSKNNNNNNNNVFFSFCERHAQGDIKFLQE